MMPTLDSDSERRRRQATALYELEMALREQEDSDFIYDVERDLFCFPEDGRFAFSRERADERLLRERGYFR
jgi:hypothetical protein